MINTGVFKRVRGFFRGVRADFSDWRDARELRRGERARERIKKRLDKEKMNEGFTRMTKKIVDKYQYSRKDAIDKAREILDTPEDDLDEIDLDILEDY